LLTDVDGVLTDGRIILDNEGRETKQFCVRDGLGAKLWAAAGHRLGIVTARSSHVVERRAAEMGVDLVRQGVESKLPAAREIIASLNLTPEEVAYLGDDLPDLPVVMHVGLGVAVADACQPLLDAADHTTTAPGGGGALRELVETLLHHQGRLKDLVEEYRRS
jgi:YrbI family 3-deoxy-D-manno-octulosonate 8-phosphate phosphatase